uniref:Uncharacterized protein n=1 Tax=Anguilla anguilla TaxID=7936 RepID=A0A0E9RTS7_ANGAN
MKRSCRPHALLLQCRGYPDLMFDGIDCQNSSAMSMSMNACSPSFFDRYSNTPHGFQENA